MAVAAPSFCSLQGVARSLTRDESKPTDLHFYQLMQMHCRAVAGISFQARQRRRQVATGGG